MFCVSPVGRQVWDGYYEPGTLIWHSRWVTTDEVLECRDVLGFPSDQHGLALLGRVEACERDVRVRVRFDA
ncbi:hypothetical protein [Actinokineospora sp. NBRC 105648]|uniref:hypothetical protein n=1 Tax=Actinokineospora sp. NBRC 105648 TaxID=3032206 RepID=UPI0024A20128|nr:hypothetical protein [Actinokineospora sp. NBRC 105648]GLZ42265.1 hypothetical protein Acsp05_58890 [Actinokineospora sp. NBRC 105648]